MKAARSILCASLISLLICSAVFADEFYWPTWRGQPGTTYERWEFPTNANPSAPDVFTNPYGMPSFSVTPSATTHYWSSFEGRQGVWKFEDFMYLDIPNNPVPNDTKLVWLQFTYYAAGGSRPIVYSNPPESLIDVVYPPTLVPGSTFWYHTAIQLTLHPNPAFEQITIEPMDCTLYVDEIVVDTICFPEPTTALMLVLPTLALLRRR